MKTPVTPLKKYFITFSVDTLHTAASVNAYSQSDAEALLNKQYPNCKINILKVEEEK